jgi:two-component system OmpR family sensor kinase
VLTRLNAPEALHVRHFNLADFLDNVLHRVGFLIGERQLHIEHRPSIELEADPDLLTQVFINLIENAVQHTDPRRMLEVGWRVTGATVVIWVSDNGEGIAPDDLPHIFEAFYRGYRSRSRRRGESGWGLAIVQTIVTAHGGQIEVDSQPGQSSRFTITPHISHR